MIAHTKCSEALTTSLCDAASESTESTESSPTNSTFPTPPLSPSKSHSKEPKHPDYLSASKAETHPRARSPTPKNTSLTSIFQDLTAQTASASAQLKDFKVPALNLATTMPKNLTRFVTRITPIVRLQDDVIEVLTWQNPSKTWIIILCFVIISIVCCS